MEARLVNDRVSNVWCHSRLVRTDRLYVAGQFHCRRHALCATEYRFSPDLLPVLLCGSGAGQLRCLCTGTAFGANLALVVSYLLALVGVCRIKQDLVGVDGVEVLTH